MSPTDTSEKALETLIVESLVNDAGYVRGNNADYSREHVVDLAKLREFLEATQPKVADVVTGKVDVRPVCVQRTGRHLAPPPGGEDLEEAIDELEPLDDLSACNAQAGAAGELEDEALAGEVA